MKKYRLSGLHVTMNLLRPNAVWQSDGRCITIWDDPRPCPTWQEIIETTEKIKNLEDSINTIWLENDEKEYNNVGSVIEKIMYGKN